MLTIRKRLYCVLIAVFILASVGFTTESQDNKTTNSVNIQSQKAQQSADDMTAESVAGMDHSTGEKAPAGIAPGLVIGNTEYDYQKNHSMNRQIGTRGDDHNIYFAWMNMPAGGATRQIYYNKYSPTGSFLRWGSTGKWVSQSWSGYTTMDVTETGDPIFAAHYTRAAIEPWVYIDTNSSPLQEDIESFVYQESQYSSEITGSATGFFWPKVAYSADLDVGQRVIHVVVGDDGDASVVDGSSKILYFRGVFNNSDPVLGLYIDWGSPLEIDANVGFNLSPVIVADRNSSQVAIVWVGGRGDGTSGGAPIPRVDGSAEGQLDNDLYIMESFNAGISWDPRENITKRPNADPGGFYPGPKISAVYSPINHDLHIAWMEGEWVGYGNSFTFGGRLVHTRTGFTTYDITVAHEALWDQTVCNPGIFNLNISNPQLSQCNGNLYLTYSQFNTGPNGYTDDCGNGVGTGGANADIAMVVSNNLGKSWDTPRNLTQTYTPNCVAGDCASEAWHTTTRYGINIAGEDFSLIPDVNSNIGGYDGDDYLFIQFIEDLYPGAAPVGEGATTYNPVKAIRFGCVEPEFPYFVRGDVDGNGIINTDDVLELDGFLNDPVLNPLLCPDAADLDDDGDIDILDEDYLLDFIGGSGSDPSPPYPDCGQDVTFPKGGISTCIDPPYFIRGDVNGDGVVDDDDSILLQNHLFGGAPIVSPIDGADVDDNGDVNLQDFSYLVSFLGGIGPPPFAPYPECGQDVTSPKEGESSCVPGGGGCCVGIRGNFDGDVLEGIDIADLVYMVEYQFGTGPPPTCLEEGDVAPIASPDGSIDIADLVMMVDYQFADPPGTGNTPGPCVVK